MHPNTRMYIFHTILNKFASALTRIICLMIKTLISWWLFSLYLIQWWYCYEGWDGRHLLESTANCWFSRGFGYYVDWPWLEMKTVWASMKKIGITNRDVVFLLMIGSPCLWTYMVWRLLSTKFLLEKPKGWYWMLKIFLRSTVIQYAALEQNSVDLVVL